MISKTCRAFIEKGLIYHPVYGSGFSNHLPMSLVALDQLGASEAQLENYYSTSSSRLDLRKTDSENGTFNFTEKALGQKDLFEDFFRYFKDRLKHTSAEKLLTEVIPVLMKGVGGAAFHPLIRLSYALRSDCRDEIAMSLAYWATEYLELGNSHQHHDESLGDIRTRLDAFTSDESFRSTITDRIKAINEAVQKAEVIIQPEVLTLKDIREFSLGEFAKADNFTLLHTVTASHAFRSASHYFENEEEALRYLWEAIVMAQLSTGIKYNGVPAKTPEIKMDWPEIIEHALNSTDDHVIKLVYTCFDENNETPDPLYHFIAQRAVSKGK